jgi:hypothetical protein
MIRWLGSHQLLASEFGLFSVSVPVPVLGFLASSAVDIFETSLFLVSGSWRFLSSVRLSLLCCCCCCCCCCLSGGSCWFEDLVLSSRSQVSAMRESVVDLSDEIQPTLAKQPTEECHTSCRLDLIKPSTCEFIYLW